MRDRLIKALENSPLELFTFGDRYSLGTISKVADHLLANGVIVPRHKPIGVMTDGNEFNSDVYCPYCGTNLSGFYGDEPTPVIQCYYCGEFLDNTKSITREEAEQALKEGESDA